FDERRLAMIDMTGGADDHADPPSRRDDRFCRNAASSSRHLRSKTSAPSATRPITGRGRFRKAALSTSTARPPPLGLKESPKLGIVSRGSAPEPIWLRQGTVSTAMPGFRAAA